MIIIFDVQIVRTLAIDNLTGSLVFWNLYLLEQLDVPSTFLAPPAGISHFSKVLYSGSEIRDQNLGR